MYKLKLDIYVSKRYNLDMKLPVKYTNIMAHKAMIQQNISFESKLSK